MQNRSVHICIALVYFDSGLSKGK